MTPVTLPHPDISVSIVSYNTSDLLRACLQSLLDREAAGEARVEIRVADNGSTDGTAAMVAREFPDVHFISTGGNIGYGRANNAALAEASGRYFFVLNSDTEVEPGCLSALLAYMDTHLDVGMCGAQLILPDGSIQRSCARDPGLASVFWEQVMLAKLLPNHSVFGAYELADWDYKSEREVEQVCGACFFVRRAAWESVKGFDPVYFMYFEDTDFCVRLRKAGWPIVFLPQARIQHRLGGSSQRDWRLRALMIASYNQSRYGYFSRNTGRWAGLCVKVFCTGGAMLRLALWTLAAVLRPNKWDQVRLFRDVLRRTLRMTPELDGM